MPLIFVVVAVASLSVVTVSVDYAERNVKLLLETTWLQLLAIALPRLLLLLESKHGGIKFHIATYIAVPPETSIHHHQTP